MCCIVLYSIVLFDDNDGVDDAVGFISYWEKVSHRRSNKIDSLRLEDFSAPHLPLSLLLARSFFVIPFPIDSIR